MLETTPAGTSGPIGAAATFDNEARDGAADGFALLLALLAAPPIASQPNGADGPGVANEGETASAAVPAGVSLSGALAAIGAASSRVLSMEDPLGAAEPPARPLVRPLPNAPLAIPTAAPGAPEPGPMPDRPPAPHFGVPPRPGEPAVPEAYGPVVADLGGMPDGAEAVRLPDAEHPPARPGRRSPVASPPGPEPSAPWGTVPMVDAAEDGRGNGPIAAASPEAGLRTDHTSAPSPLADSLGRSPAVAVPAAPTVVEDRSRMQVVAEPAPEAVQARPAGGSARTGGPHARLEASEAPARTAAASPEASIGAVDAGPAPPGPAPAGDPVGAIESLSSPARPGADPVILRPSASGPAQPPAIQIAATILERAGAPVDRLRLQLEPAELGTVEITVTADARRKARAVLLVERPETLELLQREQRSLERILSATGLQLGSGGLELGLRQEGQRRHGPSELPAPVGGSEPDRPAERVPTQRLVTLRVLDLVV